MGSAGASAGAAVLIGAAATAAAAPGWLAVGAILGGGYLVGQGTELVFDYMYDRDAQPVVPHLPIGQVSSARQPWEYGSIPVGSEKNALDVRSDRDHYNGVQVIAPSPTPNRPSDTAIQTSRDIVAGKLVDTSTGKPVYADAIIRLVAAAKTKREQAIAAAKAEEEQQGSGGGGSGGGGGGTGSGSGSGNNGTGGKKNKPSDQNIQDARDIVTGKKTDNGQKIYPDKIIRDLAATPKTTETAPAGPRSQAFPIVIDLDGDGVEISPLGGSAARFDYDGDARHGANCNRRPELKVAA